MNYIFHDSFHVGFLGHRATSMEREDVTKNNTKTFKNEGQKDTMKRMWTGAEARGRLWTPDYWIERHARLIIGSIATGLSPATQALKESLDFFSLWRCEVVLLLFEKRHRLDLRVEAEFITITIWGHKRYCVHHYETSHAQWSYNALCSAAWKQGFKIMLIFLLVLSYFIINTGAASSGSVPRLRCYVANHVWGDRTVQSFMQQAGFHTGKNSHRIILTEESDISQC